MELPVKGETTVYRHEYNGKVYHSVSYLQKNMDGNKEYAYMDAKFRRGVDVKDKTRIDIQNGWLKFWKKGKETKWQAFISEFRTIEPEQTVEPRQMSMPDQFESIDEDVPF